MSDVTAAEPKVEEKQRAAADRAASEGTAPSPMLSLLSLQRVAGNAAVAAAVQRAPVKIALPPPPPAKPAPAKPAAKPAAKPSAPAPAKPPTKPQAPAPFKPDPPAPINAPAKIPPPTLEQPATGIDWNGFFTSNSGKAIVEGSRLVPGVGLVTGLSGDGYNAVNDVKTAKSHGFSDLETASVGIRDGVALLTQAEGHVAYVAQLCHAIEVAFAPAAIVVEPANAILANVKLGLDGATLLADLVQAVVVESHDYPFTPEGDAAKQGDLANSAGNILGDGLGMVIDLYDAVTNQAGGGKTMGGGVKTSLALFKALGKEILPGVRGLLTSWGGILVSGGLSPASPAAEQPKTPAAKTPAVQNELQRVDGDGPSLKQIAAAVIDGELAQMQAGYQLGDALLDNDIKGYHASLKLADETMTKVNHGKHPTAVIKSISEQMRGELDTKVNGLHGLAAKAGTGKDKVATVQGIADKIDGFAAQLVLPPHPAKHSGVLGAVVDAAEHAAELLLAEGIARLEKYLGQARAALHEAAAQLRTHANEIAQLLQRLQESALKMADQLTKQAEDFLKNIEKAKTFEGLINAVVDSIAAGLGYTDKLRPEDLQKEYRELGPIITETRRLAKLTLSE